MSKITEMSDLELWENYCALYQTVRIHCCFGVKDVLNLNNLRAELERRDYKIELFPSAWHEDKENLEWND